MLSAPGGQRQGRERLCAAHRPAAVLASGWPRDHSPRGGGDSSTSRSSRPGLLDAQEWGTPGAGGRLVGVLGSSRPGMAVAARFLGVGVSGFSGPSRWKLTAPGAVWPRGVEAASRVLSEPGARRFFGVSGCFRRRGRLSSSPDRPVAKVPRLWAILSMRGMPTPVSLAPFKAIGPPVVAAVGESFPENWVTCVCLHCGLAEPVDDGVFLGGMKEKRRQLPCIAAKSASLLSPQWLLTRRPASMMVSKRRRRLAWARLRRLPLLMALMA
mmetsp:Transcript_26842/g.85278  ORF Transcript_26842/g.85278 Transcript_26842/m.85278 type:complete len:269 (-) Transcript_26842:1777-2583(-)